jgi:diaminopimelate decarboxylase
VIGAQAEPWLIIYDLELLRARVEELRAAFPLGVLHAPAVKACPVVRLLQRLVDWGLGLETASPGELAVALASGCQPRKIVYDSPARTTEELAAALAAGVIINADSFDELERIARLLDGADPKAPVGLRVNPGTGAGSIAATDVARRGGKFGVAIDDRAAIRTAYAQHHWLSGLHVHAGSQGYSLAALVDSVARVAELQNELATIRPPTWFDLGGGLPAAYDEAAAATLPAPAAWRAALEARLPTLFTGEIELATELGRSLFAPCALAASRVSACKPAAGATTAVIQFGADLLIRPVYQPEHWRHEFSALDGEGAPRTGDRTPVHIAGPLCFAGDVVATMYPLPPVKPGDWIIAHDVGAYTLAMWSRHCSRQRPMVVGVAADDVQVLLPRESLADLVRFWRG